MIFPTAAMKMKFRIRNGSIMDLEVLTGHRLSMWKDIYPRLSREIEKSELQTRNWIKQKIEANRLTSFIVDDLEGEVAGSGCILIKDDQPRPNYSRLQYPYLLSIYTVKRFRSMGVGSLIVGEAIKWAKKNGYDRISLHASNSGRGLYENFGFESTNEMILKF